MGHGRDVCEVKYIPPNFDPSLLPKTVKRGPQTVRIQMPMGLQCSLCGEWIAENKKFNSVKEKVQGETYLSLAIFRLLIKCPRCGNSISIKTDPQSSDYVVEWGATRNYQHIRAEAQKASEEEARREETKGDTLAEHNQKVIDARKEMTELERLEEIQFSAANRAALTDEQLLKSATARHKKTREEEEEEDRLEAERVFAKKQRTATKGNGIKKAAIEEHSDDECAVESGVALTIVAKMKRKKRSKKDKPQENSPFGLLEGY